MHSACWHTPFTPTDISLGTRKKTNANTALLSVVHCARRTRLTGAPPLPLGEVDMFYVLRSTSSMCMHLQLVPASSLSSGCSRRPCRDAPPGTRVPGSVIGTLAEAASVPMVPLPVAWPTGVTHYTLPLHAGARACAKMPSFLKKEWTQSGNADESVARAISSCLLVPHAAAHWQRQWRTCMLHRDCHSACRGGPAGGARAMGGRWVV